MLDVQLVVLAKAPVAGLSKTRLCPPLTPEEAAEVARAALLDSLAAVRQAPVRERVLVLEGTPTALPVEGFRVLPQVAGGLDVRLAGAFTAVFASCPLPALLIGMDTPQVTAAQLAAAAAALLERDSVLGLAEDGGWWTLGLHRPDPEVFVGVPMSAADTGARQAERMSSRGLSPALLPVLRDIDHVEDLRVVAALMPPDRCVPQVAKRLLPLPGLTG